MVKKNPKERKKKGLFSKIIPVKMYGFFKNPKILKNRDVRMYVIPFPYIFANFRK